MKRNDEQLDADLKAHFQKRKAAHLVPNNLHKCKLTSTRLKNNVFENTNGQFIFCPSIIWLCYA